MRSGWAPQQVTDWGLLTVLLKPGPSHQPCACTEAVVCYISQVPGIRQCARHEQLARPEALRDELEQKEPIDGHRERMERDG